jgi:hypothetical protein
VWGHPSRFSTGGRQALESRLASVQSRSSRSGKRDGSPGRARLQSCRQGRINIRLQPLGQRLPAPTPTHRPERRKVVISAGRWARPTGRKVVISLVPLLRAPSSNLPVLKCLSTSLPTCGRGSSAKRRKCSTWNTFGFWGTRLPGHLFALWLSARATMC